MSRPRHNVSADRRPLSGLDVNAGFGAVGRTPGTLHPSLKVQRRRGRKGVSNSDGELCQVDDPAGNISKHMTTVTAVRKRLSQIGPASCSTASLHLSRGQLPENLQLSNSPSPHRVFSPICFASLSSLSCMPEHAHPLTEADLCSPPRDRRVNFPSSPIQHTTLPRPAHDHTLALPEAEAFAPSGHGGQVFNTARQKQMIRRKGSFVRVRKCTLSDSVSVSASRSTVFLAPHRTASPTTALAAGEQWQAFAFDRVFAEDSNQAAVFREIGTPLVEWWLSGRNVLICAHGLPGSGKTFTLQGDLLPNSPNQGLLPRALSMFFGSRNLRDRSEIKQCRISCFHVSPQDQVCDLLPNGPRLATGFQERNGVLFVAGLGQVCVDSLEAAMVALRRANDASQLAFAHLVVVVEVSSCEGGQVRRSRLTFVELASSGSRSLCPAKACLDVICGNTPSGTCVFAQLLRDLAASESCRTAILTHITSEFAEHQQVADVLSFAESLNPSGGSVEAADWHILQEVSRSMEQLDQLEHQLDKLQTQRTKRTERDRAVRSKVQTKRDYPTPYNGRLDMHSSRKDCPTPHNGNALRQARLGTAYRAHPTPHPKRPDRVRAKMINDALGPLSRARVSTSQTLSPSHSNSLTAPRTPQQPSSPRMSSAMTLCTPLRHSGKHRPTTDGGSPIVSLHARPSRSPPQQQVLHPHLHLGSLQAKTDHGLEAYTPPPSRAAHLPPFPTMPFPPPICSTDPPTIPHDLSPTIHIAFLSPSPPPHDICHPTIDDISARVWHAIPFPDSVSSTPAHRARHYHDPRSDQAPERPRNATAGELVKTSQTVNSATATTTTTTISTTTTITITASRSVQNSHLTQNVLADNKYSSDWEGEKASESIGSRGRQDKTRIGRATLSYQLDVKLAPLLVRSLSLSRSPRTEELLIHLRGHKPPAFSMGFHSATLYLCGADFWRALLHNCADQHRQVLQRIRRSGIPCLESTGMAPGSTLLGGTLVFTDVPHAWYSTLPLLAVSLGHGHSGEALFVDLIVRCRLSADGEEEPLFAWHMCARSMVTQLLAAQ